MIKILFYTVLIHALWVNQCLGVTITQLMPVVTGEGGPTLITETLRPDGESSGTSWNDATTDETDVNDDSDSTYIYETIITGDRLFTMEDTTLTTITDVTVYHRCGLAVGGAANIGRLAGGTVSSNDLTITMTSYSWGWGVQTTTWINNLIIGVRHNTGTTEQRCTDFWAVVKGYE